MIANPIFDRLGLNPRERRLATFAAGLLAFMLLLVAPVGVQWLVHTKENDNDELRKALDAVQAARAQVRERNERKDSIQRRYAKRAPALAGFLEQNGRTYRLEVTESADRPEVPHGKRYVERNTVVHLKKAGMLAIAKFLESVEKSGMPVAVTRLNIRKRTGEPDSYDVEVGVSAYDRNEPAPSASDTEKEKKP